MRLTILATPVVSLLSAHAFSKKRASQLPVLMLRQVQFIIVAIEVTVEISMLHDTDVVLRIKEDRKKGSEPDVQVGENTAFHPITGGQAAGGIGNERVRHV